MQMDLLELIFTACVSWCFSAAIAYRKKSPKTNEGVVLLAVSVIVAAVVAGAIRLFKAGL